MGAMLTLGLVLSVSVALFELYIVATFRPEKFNPDAHSVVTRWFWQLVHELGPWIEKSPVHGLLFSFGLSIFIGIIFPAAGIMVMLAGVLSTIATQPVYMVVRKYQSLKEKGILGILKDLSK